MIASVYSIDLSELQKKVSYKDLEKGYSKERLGSDTSKCLFNLDFYARSLQKWRESKLGKGECTTLFLSRDLIEEIETYIETVGSDEDMELWDDDVLSLVKDPKKVLYIEFS